MKEPQLSGIAQALAAQGRKGDTELIHVSKDELAALRKHGSAIGINLTINPVTGLPEAFNFGGVLGSVGLPVLAIALGATNPWLLAAAGAAGGFGGTLAGGGSTDQALMSGVMGGIGGYGMGGLSEGLAQAGTKAAAEETAKQTATSAIAPNISSTGVNLSQIGQAPTATSLLNQQIAQVSPTALYQPVASGASTGLSSGASAGLNASDVASSFLSKTTPVELSGQTLNIPNAALQTPATSAAAPTGLDAVSKGWSAVTESPGALGKFASGQVGNIAKVGIGALGVGALNPTETAIVNPETTQGSSEEYVGENYIDPATGQMRTRAVRKAAEGGPMFSDYDAADAEKDGGYAPGGYLNFANGGGIGDLGSYSDGGRLLRGPGDGISDNIPATIENKRPARLADGEFVIPARAVSELGNGSTEAGSKQLYKMLDRIAAKRKSGNGLAYEANPKKLMPA